MFICFVWTAEQTAIISLYNINWLVFITEMECVYCAARTGYLYIILCSAHTAVFMCFVWISEQTAIISLYSINWLVFITERKCVYCAVRTGSLYIILCSAHTAVFMCFVWISEQTAIISLYNINWLVFITELECVYCAVRTEFSSVIQIFFTGFSRKPDSSPSTQYVFSFPPPLAPNVLPSIHSLLRRRHNLLPCET